MASARRSDRSADTRRSAITPTPPRWAISPRAGSTAAAPAGLISGGSHGLRRPYGLATPSTGGRRDPVIRAHAQPGAAAAAPVGGRTPLDPDDPADAHRGRRHRGRVRRLVHLLPT